MDFRSGTQVLKILEDGLVEHLEPPAFCLTAVEGKVAQPARECPRDFVAWARFCVDSAVGEMVSRWFLLGNGERSFEAEVLNQLIICFLNTKVFLRVWWFEHIWNIQFSEAGPGPGGPLLKQPCWGTRSSTRNSHDKSKTKMPSTWFFYCILSCLFPWSFQDISGRILKN